RRASQRSPSLAAPNAMSAGRTSNDQSRGSQTTTPELGLVAMRPHSPRRRSASRSVGRLAPSFCASSRSAGGGAAGAYTPATISPTICSKTLLVSGGELLVRAAMFGPVIAPPGGFSVIVAPRARYGLAQGTPKAAQARSAQAARKQSPPTGVTAPRARAPESARA